MSTAKDPGNGVYEILSLIFDFPSNEQRLWWHSTAPMFAAMLDNAGYSVHDQYRHLSIFKTHIIPFLGVYPTKGQERWLSILTRCGLPLELSLNCTDSVVRYAYEPINEMTGTEKDPSNTLPIIGSVQKLAQIQAGIDLEWFSYFKDELTLDESESAILQDTELVKEQIKTQNKLALDLKESQFALKVYFYPHLKSIATGNSTHFLIFDSVFKLSQKHDSIQPAFQALCDYVSRRNDSSEVDQHRALHARLLSCDLIDPAKSRVKIYLQEQTVSLPAMEDLWTLGGRRVDASTMDGLDMLRELWSLLKVPTGHLEYPKGYMELGEIPNEQLPSLVNYTLHRNDPMPEPQVYFTVFGMNDAEISNALTIFLQRHGFADMAKKYRVFLQDSYPYHDFESLNYLHSLVSFSYRRNKPYLSVYLHTFETGRWPVVADSPISFDAYRRCDLSTK
uniref:Tryptophan dimethylallyltransferase 2 n=1 Tax=Claviceps purpurea (strain 20.1) TaxID=1111077 RepID=DMAW2_CLAP2|nr:RecName: Full=Tryptophan dimethylallyltransferase 2; AltName: Full=4-dimethylallyltryptophan synthase 2; AltName: Full=All-trans-hexaprenyl-diphosphate synthase 2; AltName: Full=L-tryptophan dimethylallyl transferase 2; Short=DMATS 2 [Claviceps purpurea 20.1]CAC37396.1 putative dimethyl-allyl-tryptophan-synthase [Claviceps purpurea]